MRPYSMILNTIIAVTVLSIAAVSSCKKEEDAILRSKTYTMSTYDNSGVTGTVEFKEKENGNTTIHVHMMNVTSGATYQAHIHSGPITAPGAVQIDLGPFNATGTMVEKSTDVSTDYDDMLNYDGCFVAHNPADISMYVLVGNVGKNAM